MRILVALGLSMALPLQAAEPTGAALRAALVGAWCNSDDGGHTCWAYDEFLADGRFRACGTHPDDRRRFEGAGRFEVTGRRMCYRVDSATDSFWVRPGTRFCTDIVGIDGREHRYRDIESGQTFVLYRRDAVQPLCPIQP